MDRPVDEDARADAINFLARKAREPCFLDFACASPPFFLGKKEDILRTQLCSGRCLRRDRWRIFPGLGTRGAVDNIMPSLEEYRFNFLALGVIDGQKKEECGERESTA